MRRAAPADAAAIHALKLAAFGPFESQYTPGCFDATVLDAERIQARMTEGPIWVHAADGNLVGTVGAKLDARGAYVRGMAVHPEARRQGIGRKLLDAAVGWARDEAAPCVWLSTTTFLHGSQALYERCGFVPAEGPADLEGTPLVSYQLDL